MPPEPPAPVSVVIPCYACAMTIARAVESVAWQTWLPKEVIVVDDASPDETWAILQKLVNQHGSGWLRVIHRETNGGAGAARNTGWDAATQPYVAFLDADDTWHPMKVEIQGQFMLDHPDVMFSACQVRVITGRLEQSPRTAPGGPVVPPDVAPLTSRHLLGRNTVPTSGVMLRADLPVRFPEKRYSEDYYLWLRLVLGGWKGVVIRSELAFRYAPAYGASGLSGRLWRMERGELDTYCRLVSEGLLPARDLLWLVPWSLAKFLRRVVVARILAPARSPREIEGPRCS